MIEEYDKFAERMTEIMVEEEDDVDDQIESVMDELIRIMDERIKESNAQHPPLQENA